MELDDYKPLFPDDGKLNKELVYLFKLRPKFNMDIIWPEYKPQYIPSIVNRFPSDPIKLKDDLLRVWMENEKEFKEKGYTSASREIEKYVNKYK